jgi:hypothetical protein
MGEWQGDRAALHTLQRLGFNRRLLASGLALVGGSAGRKAISLRPTGFFIISLIANDDPSDTPWGWKR